MKTNLQISFVLTIILAIASSNLALAQGDQTKPEASPSATSASKSKEMVDAEIRKIDVEAKKITLKHGPIKSLDMPSMTMVFQVKDAAVLAQLPSLNIGDKVMFAPEQQQGAFVVTQIEKAVKK